MILRHRSADIRCPSEETIETHTTTSFTIIPSVSGRFSCAMEKKTPKYYWSLIHKYHHRVIQVIKLLKSARRSLVHAKSSGWGVSEYAAYPALMFAATPLFLYYLGSVQYGQWMFVLALNGAGLIGSMGMGPAVTKHLSAARGSGDLQLALRLAGTALLLTLASSLALSGLIVIIAVALGDSLFGKLGGPSDVILLAVTAAILIALEQLDGVYSGIMRAFERFDLAARIEIIAKFGIVAGMAILSVATGKLGPVIIFTIMATAVRLGIKAWFASRLIGHSLVMPCWDRELAADVFHFGKWIWLQTVGGALFSAADRLIVGAMLGADALARYSICIQLAQQIHMLPSAGAQFIFPLVSRRAAEGTNVRRIAILGSLGVAIFSLCLALPILLFGDQILTLWVGPSIANDAKVTLRILAFAYLVLGLGVGAHFVLLGVGKVRLVAVNNIVAGLIAIGVSAYAVRYYGLEGAALSRVAYGVVVGQIIVTFYTSVKK